MHAYEFLQRYGPAAMVIETGGEPGAAFAAELAKGGFDLLLPCSKAAELAPLAARRMCPSSKFAVASLAAGGLTDYLTDPSVHAAPAPAATQRRHRIRHDREGAAIR